MRISSQKASTASEKFTFSVSIRTSLSGYRDEGWLINVPLWAIGSISEILKNRFRAEE